LKAKELEVSLKPPLQQNVSFGYNTPEGVAMREYHVDMHKVFLDYVSHGNQMYGGNLSICLPIGVRPILMVGQDESTFHQFIFSKNQWQGPHGKQFLMPKSEQAVILPVSSTSGFNRYLRRKYAQRSMHCIGSK
jgi:hypothetical protein